jgi:hypothetical protein
LDDLVRKARADTTHAAADATRTIVGHRRNELLLGAAARKPAPLGKSLASFRKVTADRVKAKKSVGLWRGFDKKLPPPRPKTGNHLPHMVAAPRRSNPAVALTAPPSAPPAANRETIVVDDDLHAAPLKVDVLKAWLPAVAEGKTVAIKASRSRVTLKPGLTQAAKFRLTSDFLEKHRGLTGQLRKIATKPASKWVEVGSGGFAIRDLHGLRSFLVQMQRRPLVCGVAGLTGKTPVMVGPVSRYGRPVAA